MRRTITGVDETEESIDEVLNRCSKEIADKLGDLSELIIIRRYKDQSYDIDYSSMSRAEINLLLDDAKQVNLGTLGDICDEGG